MYDGTWNIIFAHVYVGSAYALRWGAGTNVGGRREEESTGLHRKRIRC